jgi:hypothetical protein
MRRPAVERAPPQEVADFKSERVAGFKSESPADFIPEWVADLHRNQQRPVHNSTSKT